MKRYISVDAGKFGTKSAEYLKEKDGIRKSMFETKVSPGDFRDDALEANTQLVEYNGTVYKIGHGAAGSGAELETSKQSEVHLLSTLTAISKFCSDNEADEISLAVGLPAKEWAVVEKRQSFKKFFPREEQTIRVKSSSTGEIKTKKFTIKRLSAYPESMGAMWQDDSPKVDDLSITGILDIGNLNLNATIWQNVELIQDESITDELGAATLIAGLAQELSANFSRVNERYVASLLGKSPEFRYLPGSTEVQKSSHELIHRYLLEHAGKIKRCCDARRWSLDYMNLIAIGGTSQILKAELKEVFGGNLKLLENPVFANAFGYLRLMCSQIPEIRKEIPLKEVEP